MERDKYIHHGINFTEELMIKQNPFSLYDFLGYFIPGALVLHTVLLIPHLSIIHSATDLISIISLKDEFQIDKFIFFIIVSYSLGHLINYVSSITIERFANWKYDYPSKYLIGINHHQKYFRKDIKRKNFFYRIFLSIIILPIFIWDLILGEYLSFKDFYTKKLDVFLIEVITQKFLVLLDTIYPPDCDGLKDKDYHRILSHYVYENSKNHQHKLSNYVALYGFLRSLCFISVLIFWLYIIYLTNNIYEYFSILNYTGLFDLIKDISLLKICILLSITIISYIYFMAFMKFYRRYTLETYMLITIDKEIIVEKKNEK